MILVGYQGIGKSTLVYKRGNGVIDLESGNFWVNGTRDDNWAQVYANIAVHLSMQGYIVCVSSHKVVRECLRKHPDINNPEISNSPMTSLPGIVAICYPDLCLKDEWILKLEKRYTTSHLDKDWKALQNAKQMFDENIKDLMSEPFPFIQIPLKSMDYSLADILDGLATYLIGTGIFEMKVIGTGISEMKGAEINDI